MSGPRVPEDAFHQSVLLSQIETDLGTWYGLPIGGRGGKARGAFGRASVSGGDNGVFEALVDLRWNRPDGVPEPLEVGGREGGAEGLELTLTLSVTLEKMERHVFGTFWRTKSSFVRPSGETNARSGWATSPPTVWLPARFRSEIPLR